MDSSPRLLVQVSLMLVVLAFAPAAASGPGQPTAVLWSDYADRIVIGHDADGDGAPDGWTDVTFGKPLPQEVLHFLPVTIERATISVSDTAVHVYGVEGGRSEVWLRRDAEAGSYSIEGGSLTVRGAVAIVRNPLGPLLDILHDRFEAVSWQDLREWVAPCQRPGRSAVLDLCSEDVHDFRRERFGPGPFDAVFQDLGPTKQLAQPDAGGGGSDPACSCEAGGPGSTSCSKGCSLAADAGGQGFSIGLQLGLNTSDGCEVSCDSGSFACCNCGPSWTSVGLGFMVVAKASCGCVAKGGCH